MSLATVTYRGRRWVVGAELARRARVEVYNLYRSLDSRRCEIIRLGRDGVCMLQLSGLVSPRVHTVTLVELSGAERYLQEVSGRDELLPLENEVAKTLCGLC